MKTTTFLTNPRREFLTKVIVALITVMAAATMASKFFVEYPKLVRVLLAFSIPLLTFLGVLACPAEKEEKEK